MMIDSFELNVTYREEFAFKEQEGGVGVETGRWWQRSTGVLNPISPVSSVIHFLIVPLALLGSVTQI